MLTSPLLMAVLVAVMAQFLVGYNTGVINAPSKVVFPSHSTMEWSLAVSAFAIGGPRELQQTPLQCTHQAYLVGAMIGGDLANDRGRRGRTPHLPPVWHALTILRRDHVHDVGVSAGR